MQKIAADKVTIMERDPASSSVTIKSFQNLTQYIITHWPWNFKKNLWSGRVYIKLSTKVFKNIYQLLHQYHKILAACNIRGERACEFSFNIAQSQYFVALMQ